jgi:molybdenum cofactor cytidylyltransferase
MGSHKLLLPLAGQTVIERVLESWRNSRVTHTVVVVRRDDEELIGRCLAVGVDVVVAAVAPPDMKASVELALGYVREHLDPSPQDVWLLAPADLPRLATAAIDAVLAAYDCRRPTAVAPTFGGERGHPLLLPWPCCEGVGRLGPSEGVNALLKTVTVREIPWCDDSIFRDLDTPGDFAREVESLNCT